MQIQRFRRRWPAFVAVVMAALSLMPLTGLGSDTRQEALAANDLWKKGIDFVKTGRFELAAEAIKKIDPVDGVAQKVGGWLAEFESKQEARREANRLDYEKYVTYARQRLERKEFRLALSWTLAALDVAEERNSLIQSDWVQQLVNDALVKADDLRQKDDWREAWYIYSQLSELFEREPRYEKLEREAATHLRLDSMFKKGSHWREYIERAQWADAKAALEHVETYYVEPADFRRVCESGLEQLLMLADSKTARDAEGLEGLQNETNRNDFKVRVTEHLNQIRKLPKVDRGECIARFRRVVEQINPQTVRLPEEVIVTEIMRGAFEPLDEFTTMIWPKETEEFEKHTRGDFIGVGISIIKNPAGEIEVVTPLEDTPAFAAGIQQGDIIAKVDGEALPTDISINKVVERITGPKDTSVTLTIRRDGQDIQFPLVRAKVKIQSVKGWKREGDESWNFWVDKENGIAYVRLSSFQRNTADDLHHAMSQLQGHGVRGLILDLRWNPGGLLESAWQIASLFLRRGDVVVSTRGRIEEDDQRLEAPTNGPYAGIPLVVLVDENSASASEIVSGAIRDDKRGTVMGERTFGKFSVQNLMPLGPSRAKLKITTARYFLPSGKSLHREPGSETWGVEPDIPFLLVQKERIKAGQLRRDADLLGPQMAKKKDEKLPSGLGPNSVPDDSPDDSVPMTEEELKAAEEKAKKATEDKSQTGEQVANAEKSDEPKLPELEQPDNNDRPKEDPQVEAALLYLRVKLLAEKHPTVATAEVERKAANP